MRRWTLWFVVGLALSWAGWCGLVVPAWAAEDEEGFIAIFDGKTLNGWDGDPELWRVEDGAITGQTTPEKPIKTNTFLIWRGGQVGDFELRCQYRILGGNSGIQYRSFEDPEKWGRWVLGGYQADIEAGDRFSGILYGERFRDILADRGQKTVIGTDHKPKVVETFGDPADLQKHIKKEDWNEYRIVAKGFHFVHYINGHKMAECIDEDTQMRRAKGLLGIQLHVGPPMKVQIRNLRIKHLAHCCQDPSLPPCEPGEGTCPGKSQSCLEAGSGQSGCPSASGCVGAAGPSACGGSQDQSSACVAMQQPRPTVVESARPKQDQTDSEKKKRIVFISGGPSHGYGGHEHYAGCMLLAKYLEQLPGVECKVYKHAWPDDPKALEGADAIVIFSDGGGRHPILPHLDEVEKLIQKGVGLVCLHYAVEVPKGKAGDALLRWIGGYFETHWSVNPFWTAEFKSFPDHPVCRGVKPFTIDDEWYYHMRFPEGMKNVTPILTAVPPDSTRERPDGPHSGNPVVRARKGMPEHVMWVIERPDGGRGMGFTGGHWHWNWANDNFRKVVLNGIAWVAKIDIPPDGIPSKTPTWEELEANQDFPKPANFNRAEWEKKIAEWNKPQ